MPGILKKFFNGRSRQWLLHGSPKKLSTALQPRLPKQGSDRPEFNVRGLYATDHVLLAVLYALFGTHGNGWGWMMDEGTTVPVRVVVRGSLVVRPGYLYVLPVRQFRLVGSRNVWRSHRPVMPVAREVVPREILRGLEKAGVIEIVKKGAA